MRLLWSLSSYWALAVWAPRRLRLAAPVDDEAGVDVRATVGFEIFSCNRRAEFVR